MNTPQDGSELTALGPVARMMMSVAGQAITSYIQFRALAEVLIEKGIITREELENQFVLMRENLLEKTIDEWFEEDIAYHLKMAISASQATPVDQAAPVDQATPVDQAAPVDQATPVDQLTRASRAERPARTGHSATDEEGRDAARHSVAPAEAGEIARARAMQGEQPSR